MPEESSWVELHRRARAIFEELLDAPPAERTASLDSLRDEDPPLWNAVRRLLEEDEAPESFLDRPLEVNPDWISDTSRSGTRIGPYTLRERLGEGGTGIVYLAERTEGDFSQRVAIKLIRAHLRGREAERRLRTERRILASLTHPNIARLLDGGATEDGIPYVVMELVEGSSVTEFCDERRLDLERRLRLFLEVCESVDYAHNRLVVHRDLKPSNILVTADGEPKLLDFGIAKLLEASEEDRTLTELRALTPAYASPEQLTGGSITTASDVYSLGVLLYELVSGQRAYVTRSETPDQLAERLERRPPPSPSVAVRRAPPEEAARASRDRGLGADQLANRLEGDLDVIVSKAMFTDPELRYGSVRQLSEDIERFLAGLPVSARAPRLGYRLGKFVRRHRWGTALGALSLTMVLGFAGLAAWRSVELERERDLAIAAEAEASRQRQRSEAVTRFLQESFALADPGATRGDELTAREVLQAGSARVRRDLASEPDLQATLLETLADVYLRLGHYDEAGPLAEQALELRRGRSGPDDLARALETLGVARLYQQEFAQAEPLIRESLELRLHSAGPGDPEVASSLFYLAYLHAWQGRYDRAEGAARRALAIRQRAANGPSVELADTWYLLAEVTRGRGDPEELEDFYRKALDAYRELGSGHELRVATSLQGLGQLQVSTGRLDEAEASLDEAVSVSRGLLGDHPLVADFLISRASVLKSQERWDEAEASMREAVRIYRVVGGERDDLVVAGLVHLGNLLLEKGDLAAAETPLREALETARVALHPDDLRRGSILNNLTAVLLRRGELAESAALCRESVPLRRRQLARGDGGEANLRAGLAHTLVLCADVLARQGRVREALPLAREAHGTYVEQGPDWRRAVSESVLGSVLGATADEDPSRAEEFLVSAHRSLETTHAGTPYAEEARDRLASFYLRIGARAKLEELSTF